MAMLHAMTAPSHDSILFWRRAPHKIYSFSSGKKSFLNETNPQKLFLLSKLCNFPIFDKMPKQFTIVTKHGSSKFNIDMIKNVSPVISDFINQNPNENTYLLNINDEENVLNKFEQLFQGKVVFFEEDDLPSSQRITKILQIKNCPNYLKPESLKINENDSNGLSVSYRNNDLNTGVVISQDNFIEFLRKEEFQTFTIKTNNNTYRCNIYGIYSSDVIRQIIDKDPTTSEFTFNFDDEFNEFQPICDIFNFHQIDITNDNMEILKELAEELQIKCIINQLDDYINKYQQITEKIDEQQAIIDSIDHLFDLLFNINYHGIEKVKISIAQSKWSQSEENVQELAAFILQVIRPNYYLHKEMANLIIQLNNEANEANELNILIPFITSKLMTFYNQQINKTSSTQKQSSSSLDRFFSRPMININANNCQNNKFYFSFIRILYKKGIIPAEEIIKILNSYDCSNRNINAFFLPEIIKYCPNSASLIITSNKNKNFDLSLDQKFGSDLNFSMYLDQFLPNKIDLYEQMLDNMEPDDELTKSLQRDDVDTLQTIISLNDFDIQTTFVPYNIFDDLDENVNILNYAALYGSLKCFKYLLLNNGEIDKLTLYFAIYGGNTEIIKIVDQRLPDENNENNNNNNNTKKFPFYNKINGYNSKQINNITIYMHDLSNDSNIIASTISMHRNAYFDWIFEKRFISKGKIGNELINIASISALSGNSHSLIEIIDKGYDLTLQDILNASQNGFYKLTQLLIHIIDQKISTNKFKNVSNSNNNLLAQNSVVFGNLSIFKILLKLMDQPTINKAIILAIKMDYKKIVEFYFNDLNSLQINSQFVLKSLIESLKKPNDEWFNFLLENFKKTRQNFFSKFEFELELLNNSCIYSNLMATKTITDEILKIKPNINFTQAFIKATSSGSMEICQYFIDKKVYINYEQLSSEVSELGSIDEKIFSMIFNNVSESTKEKFLNLIHKAIDKKNKELIEFLLKQRKPINSELFEAVQTNDLEIVNLILKYNKKPSFINQKNKKGTALHIAVCNNNIDIVKSLLSIEGIDLSLNNCENENVLLVAVKYEKIEIIEEIIKFLSVDIQSNVWIIYDCLLQIPRLYQKKNNNEKIWDMTLRLLEIKEINPNFCLKSPFLYYACQENSCNVVEKLLKLDNINPNKYESRNYNTPLMASIKNRNIQIAQLLINHPKTDLNLKNIEDESALIIAVKTKQIDIIKLLVNNEKFDPIESRLNYAFIISDSNMISESLLQVNSLDVNQSFTIIFSSNDHHHGLPHQEINSNEKIEMTTLTYSVKINDVIKIDQILNHSSFDKDKSDVKEAIFFAAYENNIDIFKKLIKLENDDINIINKNDLCLLSVAANQQSGTIIDYLLNDLSFDSKKQKILDAFIQSYAGYPSQIIKYPKSKSFTSNFPLNILNPNLLPNKSSRIELMDKILNFDKENDNVIDFNKLLPNGKSFFTCICTDNDEIEDVINYLIDHGADPTIPDAQNKKPFYHAIMISSVGFVSTLLDSNKIDHNKKFTDGKTYLHYAAAFGGPNVIKYFIDKNLIDINATDENGETPLMVACRNKRAENINCLFTYENLDYLHCNNNGNDALKIVKSVQPDEEAEARQSKESYRIRLIRCINSKILPF